MTNLGLTIWLYGAWPRWWEIVADNRKRRRFHGSEVLPPKRVKKFEFAAIIRPKGWAHDN